jgi:osmoprotectant transport system substrate-binding protein
MTERKQATNGTPAQLRRRAIGVIDVVTAVAYVLLVVVLLCKELIASSMRATDHVLVLLALLFLPPLLVVAGRLLGGAVGGAKVILKLGDFELVVEDLKKRVAEQAGATEKLDRRTQELAQEVTGKLSTAEQTLYPIIGGPNAYARSRLEKGRVVIGSKDFAANIVVAELLAQHIEATGVRCERQIPNGGTITNYAYLINGWIDLFVDYTGTGCLFLNVEHRGKSAGEILDELNRLSQERFGVEWLEPLGTRTNYCLVMREDIARKKNMRSISDLAAHDRGRLRFCGNHEFLNRRDGLPGLKEFYGLRFLDEAVCSYRERYRLVHEGKMDVGVGHTTDPEIGTLDLQQLVDDRAFFPDYYEVPIARTEALKVVPGLRDALLEFADLEIRDADITSLIQDFRDNPSSLQAEAGALLGRKRAKSPSGPAIRSGSR